MNSSQSYKRKSCDFQRLLSSSVASTLLLCSVCPALFWVGRPDGATWPWMVGSPSQIAPAPLPTRLRNFPSTLRVLPSSLNQPGIPPTLDVPSERGPAGARSPWVLSPLCLGPTHHQAALASVLTPCLAPPARRVPLPNQDPRRKPLWPLPISTRRCSALGAGRRLPTHLSGQCPGPGAPHFPVCPGPTAPLLAPAARSPRAWILEFLLMGREGLLSTQHL